MASKIEDYGLIGNMYTSALVSRSGDIDWLCAPRFDSDACFAALLGYDQHGRWSLRPTVPVRETQQRYRSDTLILETDLQCEHGTVRIIDFMPLREDACDVIRIVEGVQGEVPLELLLDVRFGYGASQPWVEPVEEGLRFTAGPDSIIVRGPVEFHVTEGRASAVLNIRHGDRLPLQLSYLKSHEPCPDLLDVEQELSKAESHWQKWIGRCQYKGQAREAVERSLLVLKALCFAPTGGIVAAPTTSLPEAIGGERNWDYRFCWLRDASLTIDAFLIGGYREEATAFRKWLLRAVAGDPRDLQIMYDITGARRLTEFELTWLPGYEDSKPARAGNAASGQFQLDVYGEVISSLYAGLRLGIAGHGEGWAPLRKTVEFVESAWQHPDDGIWEMRGGRRHFTHSKIMAWVVFDRSIKAISEFGAGGYEGAQWLPHLRALRERVHAEICQRGFNPHLNTFTQSYGSEALDASLLLIPHVGFLPASDPRVQGTVAAIERGLIRDGFVLRYNTDHSNDGLKGTEGAFLACSFWLADNYAFAGRLDEADALFNRLLSLRNPLGLLAEEYDSKLQRHVGNFPQAFSHLALIYTASVIEAMKAKRDGRPQHGPALWQHARAA
jgi:GH15 family glucan-1,4-alpha-glucosidase